jgi:predicted outer membrane repeat protein
MWFFANTQMRLTIKVENSIFLRNHAEDGGAVSVAFFFVSFRECQFIDNTAVNSGGAVVVAPRSDFEFTTCLFAKNQAREGGAVYCNKWGAIMRSCTFVGNRADPGGGAHINAPSTDGGATLWNCILAFGAGGGSVACRWDNNFSLLCCDVFGNEGGDWVPCNFTGEEAGEHIGRENFSLDPLFCAMQGNEYTLSSNSPCAPENNECGLIGAFDVGCDARINVGADPRMEATSWGRIKGRYR